MPSAGSRCGGSVKLAASLTLCLLFGCGGAQHPPTLSEKVQCQLELVHAVIDKVPDEVLYKALSGDVESLVPYVLKAGMDPAAVVDLVNAWKACAPAPAETE